MEQRTYCTLDKFENQRPAFDYFITLWELLITIYSKDIFSTTKPQGVTNHKNLLSLPKLLSKNWEHPLSLIITSDPLSFSQQVIKCRGSVFPDMPQYLEKFVFISCIPNVLHHIYPTQWSKAKIKCIRNIQNICMNHRTFSSPCDPHTLTIDKEENLEKRLSLNNWTHNTSIKDNNS